MKHVEELYQQWQNRRGLSPESEAQFHRDLEEYLKNETDSAVRRTQHYRVLKRYDAKRAS